MDAAESRAGDQRRAQEGIPRLFQGGQQRAAGAVSRPDSRYSTLSREKFTNLLLFLETPTDLTIYGYRFWEKSHLAPQAFSMVK
jgi:hypothetical protein